MFYPCPVPHGFIGEVDRASVAAEHIVDRIDQHLLAQVVGAGNDEGGGLRLLQSLSTTFCILPPFQFPIAYRKQWASTRLPARALCNARMAAPAPTTGP